MTYATFESRYQDRTYIGSGGFAKVYKVFDYAKNHYVALKVSDVRPEWKQFTLQREVELVNGIDPHRNVARYDACYRFKYGVTGDTDFAVLRFYEAGNLEQFIKRETLTDRDRRLIIKGILEGISFLHHNDIVHRDLKSQNILISREDGVWVPKITDFGLARGLGGGTTLTNSSIGITYSYAAPEQIKCERLDKTVDLWSIGVVIYRIIMDDLPFAGEKKDGKEQRGTQAQLEISRKILALELPEALPAMPEPYQTMVRRCFVLDPDERIQSADELLEILTSQDHRTALKNKSTILPIDPDGRTEEFHRDGGQTTVPVGHRNVDAAEYPVERPLQRDTFFDSDHAPPRRNPTHVLRDAPRPQPVLTAPQGIRTGRERGWLLPYLAVAVLFGALILLYWQFTPAAAPDPAVSATSPRPQLIRIQPSNASGRSLERLVSENINNNEALAGLYREIEEAIAEAPSDYRLRLLASKTLLYQKNPEAFAQLRTAAELALESGQGARLLTELRSFAADHPRLRRLTGSNDYEAVLDMLTG